MNDEFCPECGKPKESVMTKGNKEYKPTCSCNAGFKPGIILDPFMGSGTTGIVAKNQGKDFVGIELNPKYIDMAYERIKNETRVLTLF